MIASGDVQLVVNTPSGSGAHEDGALIRGARASCTASRA